MVVCMVLVVMLGKFDPRFYIQQSHTMHPKLIKTYTKWKRHTIITSMPSVEEPSDDVCPNTPPPPSVPQCTHCLTYNTPLWRRVVEDRSKPLQKKIVCNACGIYYNVHGVRRPTQPNVQRPYKPRETVVHTGLQLLANTSIEFEMMLTGIFIEPYRHSRNM